MVRKCIAYKVDVYVYLQLLLLKELWMKSTIIRYGFYAGGLMVFMFTLSWIIFGHDNYEVQEVLGYGGIIAGLIFVYFGLRKYRDHHNGGKLMFGEGLKVGLLIVLIPAVMIGLLDALYIGIFDPQFMDTYYEYMIEKAEGNTTPDQFEAALGTLESQRQMFSNPAMVGLLMFMTVFLIGIIVTVISAFILRKRAP
jgi:hypothetical protein